MAINGQIPAFFSHLVARLGRRKDVSIVAVAHMVSNTVAFAPALNDIATLNCILAKPRSVDRPEKATIEKDFQVYPQLTRAWASNSEAVASFLHAQGLRDQKVILIDIGGYFAPSVDSIADKFQGELIGIMEGTENGVQKYERIPNIRTPVVTVARSPLKLPEDFLVGSSVVFSIEAVLRESAEILQTRIAIVIGYGRVGSSIAEILRGRGITTGIYDSSPIKLAEAAAKGFQAYRRLTNALATASLVVCATGNKALDIKGFAALRNGCVVASVTSADDELDLQSLGDGYVRDEISPALARYREKRGKDFVRSFYLVADGNAANFLHGAVIGPAIQLIEGEKLAAVRCLIDSEITAGAIQEVPTAKRELVAGIWNDHFLL